MGQVKTATGRLAQRHSSAVTTVSRVRSTNQLRTIVVQESAQRLGEGVSLKGPGIVPRVARTGVSYASGDVHEDRYYSEVFEGVLSEQAVSISLAGEGYREPSRYVVNQESKRLAQYHPASAELLRQGAKADLTSLLRELEVLEAAEPFACCWNPRRHGWGLREFLATLLQQVKEELEHSKDLSRGTNSLHMAVWYVDLEDLILSAVADTGFTDGVQSRESLPIDGARALGRMATAEDWDTATWPQGPEGSGPAHLAVRSDMGARGSRLIVTPKLSGPGGLAHFRIIIQVVAFAPESQALLPDDGELRRFAHLIFDQVRGYLSLYPRLAADEIRRSIYKCRLFTEQWQAVAETIETVLRTDAVTIYARPWQDDGNLHVIAATAPLKRSDGTSLAPDPETRPVLSLLPSVHTVGDRDSYAGTLADRPGSILRRCSYRHSGDRMLREHFPLQPSPDYRESLARTESADPRFLGYALPNLQRGRKSIAVALAVRTADRAPFKAWDAAALVSMLDAAAPTVQSWRDWAAVRLDEAQRVIEETRDGVSEILGTYALSVERGSRSSRKADWHRHLHDTLRNAEQEIFQAVLADKLARGDTVPHRLQDPIPRIGSLAALSREIAADAHERAWRAVIHERARSEYGDQWSRDAQSAVLMEARGGGRTAMHPVAYYHEHLNVVPRIGADDDPRMLRVPGLGDDWCRFLDDGRPREYPSGSTTCVRIPFLAWIGQHAARGALTLDLPVEEIPSDANDFRMDLMLLARKLAAAWTASGSSLPRGQFVSGTSLKQFEENLQSHLHAVSLRLHPADPDRLPEVGEDSWLTPTIAFEQPNRRGETGPDPDAQLWGIQEAVGVSGIALRVPLVFGTIRVGHAVARWSGAELVSYLDDPRTTRALWVRDILAAWSLWSWSWTTKGHDNHPVFVDVHERDGIWVATPHYRDVWVATPHDPVAGGQQVPQPGPATQALPGVAGGDGEDCREDLCPPSRATSRRREKARRTFELMHPKP